MTFAGVLVIFSDDANTRNGFRHPLSNKYQLYKGQEVPNAMD